MILSDLNNTRYIGYVVSALYLLGIHGQKIGLQILSGSRLQNKHEYTLRALKTPRIIKYISIRVRESKSETWM